MSRVSSSFQVNAPGSLTMPAPGNWMGCHAPRAAPWGSRKTVMRPSSITSIGSATTWPPLALTFSATPSAPSVDT